MKKRFLVDTDGVLLHWGPAFEKFIKHKLGLTFDHPPEQFYKVEKLLNISHKEAHELILEFHESDYFRHLPPYRDAVKYIPMLTDLGWEFITITAAGISDRILDSRIHNLETHFGDAISEVILVDPDTTKLDILQKFHPTFWIDDSPRHVFAGKEAGHTSFFMYREDQKDNPLLNDPEIITVYNWEEVTNWLLGNYKGVA